MASIVVHRPASMCLAARHGPGHRAWMFVQYLPSTDVQELRDARTIDAFSQP
jgi:hypothetical protein